MPDYINSSSREIQVERNRSGKSGQRSRPLSCRQHIDWRGDIVTFSTPKQEAPHGGAGLQFPLGNKVMEGGIPITNRGIERARDKHKSSLLITMIRLTYQWWPQDPGRSRRPSSGSKVDHVCEKKRRESFAPRPSSPPVVVQPISL